MANFIEDLKFFGLSENMITIDLLDYHDQVRKDRNSRTGQGIIGHTEGLDTEIAGTEDRGKEYRDYCNALPFGSWVFPHMYISFSGHVIIIQSLENGSNAAGNDIDNDTTLQWEMQDNGRWKNPKTYTKAQYNTASIIYCAWVKFALEKWENIVLMEHSIYGARDHREIDTGRECPGAWDMSKVYPMAKKLWDSKMNKPEKLPEETKVLDAVIQALRLDKGNLELKLKIREDDIQKLKAQIENKEKEIFVYKSEKKSKEFNLFKKLYNLIKK